MHENDDNADAASQEKKSLLEHQAGDNPKGSGRAKVALLILSVCAVVSSLGNLVVPANSGKSDESPQANTEDRHHSISAINLKEKQIQNYINGTALMVNIHITHHAGTVFCHKMRMVGPTPEFACLGGNNWPSNETSYRQNQPWTFNDSIFMVPLMRSHFHMISWEFSKWRANLYTTNWEYPDLLSVIVMRDPIDRLLSGGKCEKKYGHLDDPTNETQHEWWEYVNTDCADNFALKVLTLDAGCCNGANTSVHYVDAAKNLLHRFTFILDQACLNESLQALAQKLNISVDLSNDIRHLNLHRIHKTARERLANDTLYEFVRHKFRRDIELYEWSKAYSIIDCSKLVK